MRGGSGLARWRWTWARACKLGWAGATRAGLQAARRRAVWRARKIRAHALGTQVSLAELARSLRVPEGEVAYAARAIRRSLGAKLPVGPADAKAILGALERWAPGPLQATLSAADRICDHVFDLLGSGPVALGSEIDWHLDFKSGYRWDRRLFYTEVPFGHVPGVDIKVPWELSRGHHLPVLAQAYLLVGDERYAREAVAQIRAWLATNPPQFGVNWASPMDVAIRAVDWLWTAGLLSEAAECDDGFSGQLLAGLLAHGRFLRANLEVCGEGVTTNHYLADVVGLLYLGLCLPDLCEAGDWRTFATQALVREMDRQVLPDGVDYESSIPYHRLVTEMFLSATALCRHHGVQLPPPFRARLERMVEFVRAYTKPNGLAPQVGDADDGRLHVLTGYGITDSRDHRHLLALGALLFEREEWWAAAGPAWPEALWFGGFRREPWNRPPQRAIRPVRSAAFSDSGLYIMRAHRDYVLINCNPVGTRGIGNHKHNDLLSLEVHFGGEDILVDPGSYLYTPDPETRNAFRGTAAHPTVMVDGAEQNRFVPGNLFCLRPDARLRVLAWEEGPTQDRLVAEHDAYCRLSDPVIHRRAVSFEREKGWIEVVDTFLHPAEGRGTHELLWAFPFSPGCSVAAVPDGWIIRAASQQVRLTPPYAELGGERLVVAAEMDSGWVASGYGVRERAPVLRWRWRGPIPLSVRFALMRA